jgi:hypothetical protein
MISNDMVYAIKVQMEQAIKDIDRLKGAFAAVQTQASKKIKGGGVDPSLLAFHKEQLAITKQQEAAYKRQATAAKQYAQELKKVDQLNKSSSGNKMMTGTAGANEMAGAFAKVAAQAFAAYQVIKQVSNAVVTGVQFNAMLESTQQAFTVMLRSAPKAVSLMKDLRDLSLQTPIGLDESAKSAKQLVAYGFQAGTLVDNMKMLGTVTAATGGRLDDLAYVYGTLRTQGRAYSRDLMQFAMRGIPIYEELAKVMEMSTTDMMSGVKAGDLTITFKEVEKAFQNMTNSGGLFAGMLDAKMNTVEGKIMTVERRWQMAMGEIAKPMELPLKGALDQIIAYLTNNNIFASIGEALGELATAILPMVVPMLSTIVNFFGLLVKTITALAKGPLGMLVTLFIKLADGLMQILNAVGAPAMSVLITTFLAAQIWASAAAGVGAMVTSLGAMKAMLISFALTPAGAIITALAAIAAAGAIVVTIIQKQETAILDETKKSLNDDTGKKIDVGYQVSGSSDVLAKDQAIIDQYITAFGRDIIKMFTAIGQEGAGTAMVRAFAETQMKSAEHSIKSIVDGAKTIGVSQKDVADALYNRGIITKQLWMDVADAADAAANYAKDQLAASKAGSKGGGVGIAEAIGINADQIFSGNSGNYNVTEAREVDATEFANILKGPWDRMLEQSLKILRQTGEMQPFDTAKSTVASQASNAIDAIASQIYKLESFQAMPESKTKSAKLKSEPSLANAGKNLVQLYELLKNLRPYADADKKGAKAKVGKEWNDPGIFEDLLPTTTLANADDLTRAYNKRIAEITRAYTDSEGAIRESTKYEGAIAIEAQKYKAELAYAASYYAGTDVTPAIKEIEAQMSRLSIAMSSVHAGAVRAELGKTFIDLSNRLKELKGSIKLSEGQELEMNVAQAKVGAVGGDRGKEAMLREAEHLKRLFDMEQDNILKLSNMEEDLNKEYAQKLFDLEKKLLEEEYAEKERLNKLKEALGQDDSFTKGLTSQAAKLNEAGGTGNQAAAGAMAGTASAVEGTDMAQLASSANVLVAVIQMIVKALLQVESIQKIFNFVNILVEQLTSLDYVLEPIVNIFEMLIEIVGEILNPILQVVAIVFDILYLALAPLIAILQIIGQVFTWLSDYIIIPIANVIIDIINAIISALNSWLGWLGVNIKLLKRMMTSWEKADYEAKLKIATDTLEAAIDYLSKRLKEEVDAAVSSLQDLYEVGAISATDYEERSKQELARLNKYDESMSLIAKYLPAVLAANNPAQIEAMLDTLIPLLEKAKNGELVDLAATNSILWKIYHQLGGKDNAVAGAAMPVTAIEASRQATDAIKRSASAQTWMPKALTGQLGIGPRELARSAASDSEFKNILKRVTDARNNVITIQKEVAAGTGDPNKLAATAKALQDAISALKNRLATLASGFTEYWRDMERYNLPFAAGTPYVPGDMSAYIHKGEIIVPKTFADGLRSGDLSLGSTTNNNGGSDVYVTVNVEGSVQAENDLAESIAKAIYQRRSLGRLTV